MRLCSQNPSSSVGSMAGNDLAKDQVCDLDPDPDSHDLLGKIWVLMRKQLRSVVRSSCQNADVEKQGEGWQQRIFSACLAVLNAKV